MLDEEYMYLVPEESNGVITENVGEMRRIENSLRKVFSEYKITETLVPSFEYLELYKGVYENFDEEKIFKYVGKDGKVIALRWDYTIPIARHYAAQNKNEEGRYSCFGKVYRKARKYKGRNSEDFQAGIELINKAGVSGNIECLEILQKTLPFFGLKNLKIEIGSAKLFNRICELAGDTDTIVEILSKKNISAMEEFVKNKQFNERLSKFLLKLTRSCGNINMLNEVINSVQDAVILQSLKEMRETYENMINKDNIIFDLGMCPSMQYYTCLMFKVYSPNAPEPIVSGGRYDSLFKNFHKDIPAIGMGYYLNNVLKAIAKEGENND